MERKVGNGVRPNFVSRVVPSQIKCRYLSGALAMHFVANSGGPKNSWIVTKKEIYKQGMRLMEKGLYVPSETKHDWSDVS